MSRDPQFDEAAGVARAQAGDPDAFCALVEPYEERLYRQACALGGGPNGAEELAQETLVQAWRSLKRFHGRCQLFTWLSGILLNVHRNAARKSQVRTSCTQPEVGDERMELAEGIWGSAVPPDALLLGSERAAMVRQCLDRLPAKQRDVIYLRFFVDDSIEGIAAALECSPGTVKSRLFYALEKLNAMPELTPLNPLKG